MAENTPVVICTEAFDAAAASWLIHHATVADLTDGATGAYCLGAHSSFARLQGMGGAAFDAEGALKILKAQVAEWVRMKGKVFYRYGTNFAAVKGGRLVASRGYQNWPKLIRATLAHKHYTDVDMVNAQPVLLCAIAQSHGWAHTRLAQYVENRDAMMAASHLGGDLKQEVLAVLCGCREERVQDDAWLHELWKEVRAMQEACWTTPQYEPLKVGVEASQAAKRKALGARANKAYDNSKGALLALVMQTLERQCLTAIRDRMSLQHHLSMDTLIHDGGLVRTGGFSALTDDVLRDCEAFVQTVLGVRVTLAIKPWPTPLVVPVELPPVPGKVVKTLGKKRLRNGRKKRKGDAASEAEEASGDEDEEEFNKKYICKGVTREAYAKMKAEFEQSHFYYVPGNTFVEVTPSGLRYYEQRHAKEYFDIKWAFGGMQNFRYRVSFLDLWRLDPDRRCIHRIDFQPSDDPTVFYMPVEFEFQRAGKADVEVSEEEREELMKMFETLVMAAAGEQADLRDYLYSFFAHMVQKPLEQPGVAIILTGAKGVGKDTLLDFFRLHVIGPAFSHNYTETRQFFDKHDVDRKDKFFIKVEDSDSALCKQHAKDLRARITARESTINPKGKDPVTFNNYARYFFTANQAIPVGINDDNDRERRFVILAVASTLKGNTDFFSRCYDGERGLFSDKGGRVVADFLLGRDISKFAVRVQPKNEYQEALYEVERSPEQRFVEDGWEAGLEIKSQDAFQMFQRFCSDNGFPKWTETAIAFGQKLAYFVMKKQLVKRVGAKKQVYYKKPAEEGGGGGAMDEDEASTSHMGPPAGAGTGAFFSSSSAFHSGTVTF